MTHTQDNELKTILIQALKSLHIDDLEHEKLIDQVLLALAKKNVEIPNIEKSHQEILEFITEQLGRTNLELNNPENVETLTRFLEIIFASISPTPVSSPKPTQKR